MLKSDDINYNRYNLRSNVDVSLTEKLKVGIDFSFTTNDYIGPRNNVERNSSAVGIMTMLRRGRAYWPLQFGPDPTKLTINENMDANVDVFAEIDNVGYNKWYDLQGDAKINLSYDLPFGFKVKAILNYNRFYYSEKTKVIKKQYILMIMAFTHRKDTPTTRQNYMNIDL